MDQLIEEAVEIRLHPETSTGMGVSNSFGPGTQ
jgi:hypothetical protein